MQKSPEHRFTVYLPEISLCQDLQENPFLSWQESILVKNTTEQLIEIDPFGKVTLNLLESCSISTDGLTYRFQLKKGSYFWDHSEITSDDVITSLQHISRKKESISNLGRLLKFEGCEMEKSFKRHTRYRFEMFLKDPVNDLLARLALPECAIFKKTSDTSQPKQKIYSGPWKIVSQDEGLIELEACEHHSKVNKCPYSKIAIKKMGYLDEFDYNQKDPYAILFPGTDRRIPRTNSLVEYQSFSLNLGLSVFITLKSEPKNSIVQNCFYRIAKDFLKKKKNWNRFPLKSFLPLGHKLHQQFVEKGGRNPATYQEKLVIGTPRDLVSRQFLDRFSANAKEAGLDLKFEPLDELDPIHNAKKVDGYLWGYPYSGFFDLFSAPYYLKSKAGEIFNSGANFKKKLKNICDETDDTRRLRAYSELQKQMLYQSKFIPFVGAPITVITNREYRNSEQQNYMAFHRFSASPLKVEERHHSQETLAAIGSAVQMFAHDVKKPFSMIQGVLSLLESTSDPQKIKDIARNFLPEVKKTVFNVQGLIFDIAEIGSNLDILPEPFSVKLLAKEILQELFFLEKKFNCHFKYQFKHSHLIEGDRAKIARVFSNIIGNAKEAMGHQGIISIATSEKMVGQERLIECSIKNTGTFIPPIERDRIFESFYTKGKKGGTGLGLAISKKVIEKHGGEIWCHSDLNEGTVFYFTLPASREKEIKKNIHLPLSSQEIASNNNQEPFQAKQEPYILPAFVRSLQQRGKIKILVVDDERVYTNIIRNLVESIEQLNGLAEVDAALDCETAIAKLKATTYDLIFIDVDLGIHSEDGFELTRRCRESNISGKICIHSNRGAFALQKKALDAGADLCLPKPISIEVFVKLLEDIFKPSKQKKRKDKKPLVIIDDDVFILEEWKETYYPTLTYESPEDFFADLQKRNLKLDDALAIITDYIFQNSRKNGADLAQKVDRTNVSIYLSTDLSSIAPEEADLFQKVLPKDPGAILRFLEQKNLLH